MDPVGPWSYTYNRLAAGAAAGATSGDFHHHLATAAANNATVGAPATTSQLLAQAAHTTSLGTSASSAYPGGFLSPPTVGYDAVFTPFLHHPNPKPAHYSSTINAQHRQALAQAAVVTKPVESDYAAPAAAHHQPQTSAFFEQASSGSGSGGGSASGSASGSTITWQGGGNQLPSPFGILPHENVPSSPGGGASSKSSATGSNPASAAAASVYDNFNAHIAAQSLYHINTQLAANAAAAVAANKVAAAAAAVRSASPQVSSANKITTPSNFYQSVPAGYAAAAAAAAAAESLTSSYPSTVISQKAPAAGNQGDFGSSSPGGSKSSSSASNSSSLNNSNNVGQSCVIVSASPPSKDYRVLATIVNSTSGHSSSTSTTPSTVQTPIKLKGRQYLGPPQLQKQPQQQQQMTKAQSKVYPETNGERVVEVPPQSSPISYTVPERLNSYGTTTGVSKSSPVSNRPNTNSPAMQTFQQATPPYRHYQQQQQQQPKEVEVTFTRVGKSSSGSGSGSAGSAATDSQYSSSASTGSSEGGRRPSPHQTPSHSQASPQMSHVPSPANYPMYNSPMNSMSSPQQTEQHFHHPPRSPLDVTISRANAIQNPVAYSSVITRAVADATRYAHDRVPQQQPSPQQQNCWESSQQQQTKRSTYATTNYEQQQASNTGITILQDLSNCRGDPMSIVRALQQAEQQVTQQNQQTTQQPVQQQGTNEVQQIEIKTPVPKRRGRKVASDKSDSEKEASDNQEEYYQNRVPPPAHSSTAVSANQQQSAAPAQRSGQNGGQQQNGSFFDLERWNLPPPPPKMFSSGNTGSAFSTQASFGQTAQSLMVPHPPPLPYFPAFHLAPGAHHPTTDFSLASQTDAAYGSGVDVYQHPPVPDTPSSSNSNNVASSLDSCNSHDVREDEPPKVVVPNIEEELGFLAERGGGGAAASAPVQHQQIVGNTMGQSTMVAGQQQQQQQQQEEQNIAKSIAEKKYNLPKGVGSGFMGSYLKFLQGERDTSPPPASRGGRKATWSRTAAAANASTAASSQTTSTTSTMKNTQAAAYNPNQQQISNGVNIHSQQIINPGGNQGQASEIDDGRYYQQSRNNSKRKYDEQDDERKKAVKMVDKNDVGKDAKKTRVQQQPPQQNTLQTLQPTPSVVQATAPPHLPLHPHPHHHHPQPPPQMMQQSYYQQPDEGAFNFFDLHLRRQRW